jgi:hypothetical protein
MLSLVAQELAQGLQRYRLRVVPYKALKIFGNYSSGHFKRTSQQNL